MSSQSALFVGVDVGTGSARAALVAASGEVLRVATRPIDVHNPKHDYYEQSSEQIWQAVCACVSEICSREEDAARVQAIGFDATCSLVLIDESDNTISVNVASAPQWDVLLWMDHRATLEADHINGVDSERFSGRVLRTVGGVISPEMQMPKLLWLKRNLPEDKWAKLHHALDLSDFLTWKATGQASRSLCAAVCKWNYAVKEVNGVDGWHKEYLEAIGLADLAHDGFARLGKRDVKTPGSVCGCLSASAAAAMGLRSAIPVATSLIDAHAGALGMLACREARLLSPGFEGQLGLICGTSSCHILLNTKPWLVSGVWGPYDSALGVEDMWLLEGGQTAVGSLIDHVVKSHPAYLALLNEVRSGCSEPEAHGRVLKQLEAALERLRVAQGLDHVAQLTKYVHVQPDFHGNRAPMADPRMRGAVCGLTLDDHTRDDLAVKYLAVVQAVAYGSKHIVQQIQSHAPEVRISVATICGGLSRSSLFVQTHADVLAVAVVRPDEAESVLLGAAMLAMRAKASADSGGRAVPMGDVVSSAGCGGQVFKPTQCQQLKGFHLKKYAVFQAMIEDQIKYRSIMEKES